MTSLIGAVLKVDLPEARPRGIEQARPRPAIVVGVPDLIAPQKYPGLIVVPLTSKVEKYGDFDRRLYPILSQDVGGLTTVSIALCPQVRFIGASRVQAYLGHLPADDIEIIRAALRQMLAL